uniref:Receptor expression-enhancing protein n=1 Tax=Phallusia mammillata TaxID=59560 RepID=A0A6F9DPZ9_9ASCI|nr:receptor expression-enhancing protein 2-like [Phallusia mammillata]
MGGAVVSRLAIVGGGLLYPAYSSYKAVKTTNVRQYVRWIMYWVVFALFTSVETFADIFVAWLPFYYEAKFMFVFWLASPYTKGSTYLYRKFIHPNLSKKEQDIDLFLENAKDKGYEAMVNVGSRGFNLAANAVVTAAVKGQAVVTDKLRSYSTLDLTQLPETAEIHRQTGSPIGNPALVRELNQRSSNPVVALDTETYHDGGSGEPRLTNQFKAYSMMNLSSSNLDESGAMLETVPDDYDMENEFSTAPPTHTSDDMQITRRTNYAEEAVPQPNFSRERYLTMPRKKKGHKSKTKHLPPLPADQQTEPRRSKRKSKTRPNYDEESE